ncbi:unnamed protein product [Didymodactylos carnosus]|uniref:Uncharacterized protein n=1 Tax=Didymodactylos carnosus TaxID=1234261 RepID=A0A814JLC2_9BILA|nr:unnamed protein product [Didymodactylos carnosus]CAF1272778.1 unnamed protein product [Didymodactylos carnosus]CAF3807591.1 unnamed protein product [Didymodactylos carnosus]CAF4078098.1 unnamed protein product [Didymodactylos carnosus]
MFNAMAKNWNIVQERWSKKKHGHYQKPKEVDVKKMDNISFKPELPMYADEKQLTTRGNNKTENESCLSNHHKALRTLLLEAIKGKKKVTENNIDTVLQYVTNEVIKNDALLTSGNSQNCTRIIKIPALTFRKEYSNRHHDYSFNEFVVTIKRLYPKIADDLTLKVSVVSDCSYCDETNCIHDCENIFLLKEVHTNDLQLLKVRTTMNVRNVKKLANIYMLNPTVLTLNLYLRRKPLYMSGLISNAFSANDDQRMPQCGIGFTNIVQPPTKAALSSAESNITI